MILLSISENILLFVSGFGIMQAVLLSALLTFHPKSDRSVNGYLALHISALTMPMLLPVAQHLFSWQIMLFLEPFLTLIGPLLYLYVRSFREAVTLRKAWPHFILFFACIPLAIWDYNAVGLQYPSSQDIPPDVTKHPLLMVPLSIRLLQRITYYFLSRKVLNTYQRSILYLFSDTSRINLNWVRWLINGYLALIVMTVVFYPLMLRYPEYFASWVLIQAALVSVYIYLAAFKGMTQLTLWQIQPGLDKGIVQEEMQEVQDLLSPGVAGPPDQSRKTEASNPRMEEIAGKIMALMEEEKLYQEAELTLQDLANKLQYPSYQVSQAINDRLNKNFYDLVNGYRVEEAKRLLLDNKSSNFTILSIGFEAGFNSKTTFNTVFKKLTGRTPSEFRQSHSQLLTSSERSVL